MDGRCGVAGGSSGFLCPGREGGEGRKTRVGMEWNVSWREREDGVDCVCMSLVRLWWRVGDALGSMRWGLLSAAVYGRSRGVLALYLYIDRYIDRYIYT